jgi:hypothetical protein
MLLRLQLSRNYDTLPAWRLDRRVSEPWRESLSGGREYGAR